MKAAAKINYPRMLQLRARLWSLTKIPIIISLALFGTAWLCDEFGVRLGAALIWLGCLSLVVTILMAIAVSAIEVVTELFYRKIRTLGGVFGTLLFHVAFCGLLLFFAFGLVAHILILR